MIRCLLACVAVLVAGQWSQAARVVLPAAAPSLFQRLDPGITVPAPRVRIGLSLRDDRVVISSTSGDLRILDGSTGAAVATSRAPGDLLVVAEGGVDARVEKIYRVQVGSFRSESGAVELARKLEKEFAAPASAAWQANRGVWRVRVGRQERRAGLSELLSLLRQAGYSDAWITSEPARRNPGGKLRLIDSRWDMHSGGSSLVFVPEGKARITVDGRSYRGLVEVSLTAYGELVVINELNLEQYLRGVVPEELGPAAFPELEALKAQAVAARTYILANLGQFSAQGYDICDTPRCQVYGGAGSEHPLSDRAVRETGGRILVHRGRPINAMYTSTCGGHTEDVEKVFPDIEGPYLRGVRCVAPSSRLAQLKIPLSGRPVAGAPVPPAPRLADPLPIARLVAWGVVPSEAFDPAWQAQPVSLKQVAGWLHALGEQAGKPIPPEPAGRPNRVTLWRWWWALLGLQDAGHSLVAAGDESVVLTAADRRKLAPEDRLRVATLMAMGIVRPGSDGLLSPDQIPSRVEVLGWLLGSADRYDAWLLRDGVTRKAARRGGVVLQERRIERRFAVDRDNLPLLLAATPDGWIRMPELTLMPGDKVSFVADAAGRLQLLAVRERRGVADDRFSRRYRWTKNRTRKQLEKSLESVAPVGRLENLELMGRGKSGRVVALKITGSKSVATVEGFRLRRALNLPETLFDLEILRDKSGRLEQVVFTGRGWGHGVGMCQFGSYGMALRGSTYEQILHHYYSGVRLVRAP